MSKYDEALARVVGKGNEAIERITGKSIEQFQAERTTPKTPTAFDLAIKPYAEQFRPQNFPETQYHDVKSTNHLGDFGRGSLQSTMWLPDVGLYTYDKAWQGWNNIGQWIAGTPLAEIDTESNRNTFRNLLKDNVGLDFDEASSILEDGKSCLSC